MSFLKKLLRDPILQGIAALIIILSSLFALIPTLRDWVSPILTPLFRVLGELFFAIGPILSWVLLIWLICLTILFYRLEHAKSEREFRDNFKLGLVNWEYKGEWRNIKEGSDSILTVTQSDEGGIAKPCRLWNDYIFEFDTKIVKDTSTWIIRASSLSEYVMLHCQPDYIARHYRTRNQWLLLDYLPINPHLPTLEWFHVQIRVSGSRVVVIATSHGTPQTLFDDMLLDSNPKLVSQQEFVGTGWRWTDQKFPYIPNHQAGSVGFRESFWECAQFRNVRVVKI